jgi:formylglycine-generating enzyme required for sulfatase activity
MILIPEGEFLMGTVEDDTMAREFEKPVHNVFVDAFYMDKYSVTNRQYLLFMEQSGYKPQAVQGSASWG